MPDLFLPRRDHGERRRLHPAAGKLRVILAGERAGGVDPHQPVRFRSCHRRPVQILVLLRILKMRKSLPDGLICHRGNPQTAKGLLTACLNDDPPRHQLAFPSGVRGDDHLGNVFALHLILHRLKLPPRLRNHHQFQVLRHHRQIFHPPGLKLLIITLRIRQRHQMPQPPGDYIFITFDIIFRLLFAAKHPGDISCHRGLLC